MKPAGIIWRDIAAGIVYSGINMVVDSIGSRYAWMLAWLLWLKK